MAETTSITQRPAWQALSTHYRQIKDVHLRTLFAHDPQRGERFTAEAAGLYLDYCKHRITDETLRLLLNLALESGLRERIDAMFRGEKINITENRAVLHVALRAPRDQRIFVDGHDVVPDVHVVLDKMSDFARRVRTPAAHPQRRQSNNRCCTGLHCEFLGRKLHNLRCRASML